MDDRLQHFAAHPYYLMGVSAERDRIIELVKVSHPKGHNDQPKPLCSTCVLMERIGATK